MGKLDVLFRVGPPEERDKLPHIVAGGGEMDMSVVVLEGANADGIS